MPTVSTYVDVDVDLTDFDTDDLIEELESRGKLMSTTNNPSDNQELLTSIYENRRLGKCYQRELDELIYHVLGRIL